MAVVLGRVGWCDRGAGCRLPLQRRDGAIRLTCRWSFGLLDQAWHGVSSTIFALVADPMSTFRRACLSFHTSWALPDPIARSWSWPNGSCRGTGCGLRHRAPRRLSRRTRLSDGGGRCLADGRV